MSTVAITGNRQRPEKVYQVYGRVATADYTLGDTLSFTQADVKQLISAKFVAGTVSLELYNGTTISSPIALNIGTGSKAAIDYVITYVKGAPSSTIQLLVTSTT